MSNLQKDIETFRRLYSDEFFKPDEIKFYPTSVIPNTELYELYLAGHYIPLKTDEIKQIIEKTFIEIIPPYTRIKRLIRDIPSTEIVA
jgi:elongator complex protein 3